MKDMHKDSTSRITTQQQTIFQIVKGSGEHLTVDQVYQAVRRTLPRISLATVYRNLEKLTENNMVGKAVLGGVYYFELETQPHYHVICLGCKQVENLEVAQASDIESYFTRYTNYKLTGHELVLFGICDKCQKRR